jgi:RNA polymerase sigma-70 factor (ECF subfamily)
MARAEFRHVFDTEFSYVWNTLRRLGVRESDLNDQAQEVFLTVHGLLDEYDPTRPLRPWLFAIAWRSAARYRSLPRFRRELVGETVDVPDPSLPADEQVASRQARALFLRALEHVAPSRRAVFVMAEIDQHNAPEIAEALGVPLNTVYSRLRLAREEFAQAARRLRSAP